MDAIEIRTLCQRNDDRGWASALTAPPEFQARIAEMRQAFIKYKTPFPKVATTVIRTVASATQETVNAVERLRERLSKAGIF